MVRLGRSYPVSRVVRPSMLWPSVTYLADGPGATSATSPITYTDSIPTSTNCTLIWATYFATTATPTISATIGSTSATLVSTVAGAASNPFYYLTCFQVPSPPTGSQTVTLTLSSVSGCAVNTVHYSGVAAVGAVTSLGNQSGSPSISVTSSNPVYRYVQATTYRIAATGNTFSAFNQTQRYLIAGTVALNGPLLIGDALGNNGTLTFSSTRSSTTNPWDAMIVPLIP